MKPGFAALGATRSRTLVSGDKALAAGRKHVPLWIECLIGLCAKTGLEIWQRA
jgi:hypothetical protein